MSEPSRAAQLETCARGLHLIAAHRRDVLEHVAALRRSAADRHQREQAHAKVIHREANRELIDAVDHALTAGLRMTEIAGHVGLSSQSIHVIRREVRTWTKEEGNADPAAQLGSAA